MTALETTPLLDVLRNQLDLKGTRYGCGLEQCGSCMVLLDGEPIYACSREIGTVAGRSITTIEGLGSAAQPHPLQQAFLDEQAGQCGYCLSGIVISAKALLDRNPSPTRADIVAALDKHLCRCGAHPRILRAVEKAAAMLRGGKRVMSDTLPLSIQNNRRMEKWIRFDPDRTVRLAVGKVELGQGNVTALAQIAADELDVDLDRIAVLSGDTRGCAGRRPDDGQPVDRGVRPFGAAGLGGVARARAGSAGAAAELQPDGIVGGGWRVPARRCADRATTIGTLRIGRGLRRARSKATRRRSRTRRIAMVGKPDAAARSAGEGRRRRLRPRHGAARHAARAHPAPAVPRRAVWRRWTRRRCGVPNAANSASCASATSSRSSARMRAVVQRAAAAAPMHAKWDNVRQITPEQQEAAWLVGQASDDRVLGAELPAAETANVVTASYSRPYVAHASMAPSCALAEYRDGHLSVWSHTQGVYPLRTALANVLGIAQDAITVRHAHGAGCYGHNGADDVAVDAAVIAMQIPDHCIRVQWRREEEFGFEPFGPAMHVTLRAALDDAGKPVDWTAEIWSPTHVQRPSTGGNLLTHEALPTPPPDPRPTDPPEANGGGGTRNAFPLYDFRGQARDPSPGAASRRCARRRCAGSARCRTCSRSSASWTNWRSVPASIRWSTGCRCCPIRARAA